MRMETTKGSARPATLKKYCNVVNMVLRPDTYGGISKNNRRAGTPLTTDAYAAGQGTSPVRPAEDFEEGGVLGDPAQLPLYLDTVLNDAVFPFLIPTYDISATLFAG